MFTIEFQAGRWCPVAICDGCGRRVEDAKAAGVVWAVDREGRTSALRVLCKPADCLLRYSGHWEELVVFLPNLAHNVNLGSLKAWRSAQRQAESSSFF